MDDQKRLAIRMKPLFFLLVTLAFSATEVHAGKLGSLRNATKSSSPKKSSNSSKKSSQRSRREDRKERDGGSLLDIATSVVSASISSGSSSDDSAPSRKSTPRVSKPSPPTNSPRSATRMAANPPSRKLDRIRDSVNHSEPGRVTRPHRGDRHRPPYRPHRSRGRSPRSANHGLSFYAQYGSPIYDPIYDPIWTPYEVGVPQPVSVTEVYSTVPAPTQPILQPALPAHATASAGGYPSPSALPGPSVLGQGCLADNVVPMSPTSMGADGAVGVVTERAVAVDPFDVLPDFQVRFEIDYAGDEADVDRSGFGLLLNATAGFGIDTGARIFRESSDDFRDHLWLGDFNIVYELFPNEFVRTRAGIGFNWLSDAYGSDAGLNLTLGTELFAGPIIFTGEVDMGTLGDADLFHGRLTAAISNGDHVEFFAGYDFLDIGGTEIRGAVAGIRFRL